MLRKLFRQIEAALEQGAEASAAERAESVRLATAVLLAEVANADRQLKDSELAALSSLLQVHFDLTEAGAREIVFDGLAGAEDAVSLQGFTRTLHESLSAAEKLAVIEMMWTLAYVDDVLDKHEDALITRVGE
ncbi:MAG: TerB family tellurite resistance protein, partial [Pseudomonadota bacterium]